MKELILYIAKDKHISIRRQCQMLGVSRSRLYYEPLGESQKNLMLMRLMDEEFLNHPTHGVLQMQDFLRSQCFVVNEKRIRRLLRKMGVMAIYPGRNLSRLGQAKYVRPYLLRGLKIERATRYGRSTSPTWPCKGGLCTLRPLSMFTPVTWLAGISSTHWMPATP